jgi:hypothetical protein
MTATTKPLVGVSHVQSDVCDPVRPVGGSQIREVQIVAYTERNGDVDKGRRAARGRQRDLLGKAEQ